jgi:NADH-quinone oxidoreductase subunit G
VSLEVVLAIIYIDNKPYEVGDGQNLLHACLSLGFDIPYFCWHPAMHSVGACRQCAVKIFRDETDRHGRVVMSCMTPAAHGTRLSIDDPEAREFRASNIEWLMTNHPHDCPVCDEGGECHLQDMTVMTGHVYRRFRFRKRTHLNQDLGPFVNHEMNRCIQCYRCVRFYRDYAGGRDFNVFSSHNSVYFGRHEDGVLQSEFSGNLVEVCPTGVFTDKTLKKHYTRKWDLQAAPSVCVHCGVGCNTIAGERYGILRRIQNRYNGEVNGYFLCDRGRYGYEFINGGDRVRNPLYRRRGATAERIAEETTREQCLQAISAFINPGGSGIIGVGSSRASCETNFALLKFVGQENFCSGLGRKDHRLMAAILQVIAKGPARVPSLKDVERCDAVFIVGEDIFNTAPRLALALHHAAKQKPMAIAQKLDIPYWDDAAVREAIQDERSPMFVATPAATRLDALATSIFRAAPDDIARLGFAVAHVLREDAPAVPGLTEDMRSRAELIAQAFRGAERPLVISGTAMGDEALIQAAANVATALCAMGKKASLYYVTPECNSLGLGIFGGIPLEEAAETLERKSADTLVIVENDLYRRADRRLIDRLLAAARNVIVIDHTKGATIARADVILPAAAFAEGSGTLVSSEGRAQRYYRVFDAIGDVSESWRWLREIMSVVGYHRAPAWQNLDDVTAAMGEEIPILKTLRESFPGAAFRMAGQKIPRQPHRYSGRTAMAAQCSVHEAKPPDDLDSPLAFSMEGFGGEPPPALLARFWAPGWNSVQSVNKFQKEVGGPLRGSDPGVRLFDTRDGGIVSYFQASSSPVKTPRPGEVLMVPIYHIFGSEELSIHSPGIAGLCPIPYVALNPADGQTCGFRDGQVVGIFLPGHELRLPVRFDESLPQGVAGMPAGLPALSGITLPVCVRLLPDSKEREKGTPAP